jgi:CheY-like chemotaxis protein
MGKTILFVDDYDDIRTVVTTMIALRGFTVLEASDGHDAVEMTRAHRPDLVLMDLAMPGINGFEAAREIRSYPDVSRTPLIAVTSHGEHYREVAIQAGFDDVVDKAQFMDGMFEMIELYLSGGARPAVKVIDLSTKTLE